MFAEYLRISPYQTLSVLLFYFFSFGLGPPTVSRRRLKLSFFSLFEISLLTINMSTKMPFALW
ncbi:hypothetical protein C1646_690047 [Rhizophagus diaphanus]|nr:hypothetical protein C1646_690047 [Rhizophagus diaphanus] [Rhizophagus sp. MUCL 43196]